jgi:hypothetical protein
VLCLASDQKRLLAHDVGVGPAGTWHITQDLSSYSCGKLTLRVTAVPYVQDGVSQVHCLNRSTFVKQTFEISCAPVAEGEGPFTQAVTCMPGQKISFKVRDRDGRGLWSNVAELGCGKTE